MSYKEINKYASSLSVTAKVVFIYSILSGLMERKLVLEACLRRGSWGLLEMYILLTDDIVEFDVHPTSGMWDDLDNLVTAREQLASAIGIKLDYKQYSDLFLLLLMVKCPVSNN